MPSNHSIHRGIRIPGLLLLALALAITAFAAAAPRADAAPVNLTFDNGRLTIGSIFNNRVVLPASPTFPSDDLPTPQRTDIQLTGDLTDGDVTIPASSNTGAQFPYMYLEHPVTPELKIPVTLRMNEPGLTGTWNAATGEMNLDGTLDLIVVTGLGNNMPPDLSIDLGTPPLSLFARCRMNDLPVRLSTETKTPTTAQRFTGGFGVNGALTTNWNDLPNPISENGGDCPQLDPYIHAKGGLWLSNAVVEPIPQEIPQETCETKPTLCPPEPFSEIDDVRLTPKRKTVKPGKKVVLKVRVHNVGNQAVAAQPVKLKSSNKRVKVPKKIKVKVPAEGWGTAKVVVRVKGKAKGKARITASSNGWSNTSVLKIKKKK